MSSGQAWTRFWPSSWYTNNHDIATIQGNAIQPPEWYYYWEKNIPYLCSIDAIPSQHWSIFPHEAIKANIYIQNVTTKSFVKKSVRFSLQSNTICLDHMIKMECAYIEKYGEFHSFPQFLQRQKIFKTTFVKTKDMDGQEATINIFHTLRSCPATSGRDISLLYQWNWLSDAETLVKILWCLHKCRI